MFYDRFIELCNNAGVTPAKVADTIGLNKSTMYMWKKQGTTPKYDTLQKLAEYFSVSVNHLLGVEDFPYEEQMGKIQLHKENATGLLNASFTLPPEIENDPKFKESMDKFLNSLIGMTVEDAIALSSYAEYLMSKRPQPSTELPQAPPEPQEGRDTTPPPEGAEGTGEGE